MMRQLPIAPLPISGRLPSELGFLSNHISGYFGTQAPYNNAALGALIFTPPPQEPRLLLVQISAYTDPHAFSAAWEAPNGLPQ